MAAIGHVAAIGVADTIEISACHTSG